MESNCSAQLNPCSVGLALNEECHLNRHYRGKHGLMTAPNLSEKKKRLLRWRASIPFEGEESTICYHHEKKFISLYENLQRQCCDPYNKHPKAVKSKYIFTCTLFYHVHFIEESNYSTSNHHFKAYV